MGNREAGERFVGSTNLTENDVDPGVPLISLSYNMSGQKSQGMAR
jgi:hypothetical protein